MRLQGLLGIHIHDTEMRHATESNQFQSVVTAGNHLKKGLLWLSA